MIYQPRAGDIVKMHSWHGVILKVFTNDNGGTVLQVQTVRNVFRGYPPEFIEVEAAPEAITPASQADLEEEIKYWRRMREIGLQQMLAGIRS
jgi:hypothetical protein